MKTSLLKKISGSRASNLSYQGLDNRGRDICAGAEYTRPAFGCITEKARVLSVAKDGFGIPHVRFLHMMARGAQTQSSETRTLSLDSFCSRFRSLV